jgi:hypothetical protein
MTQSDRIPEGYPAGGEHPHTISIPLYLVFAILTCGLFNLYWNYRQIDACNDLLRRKEFSFWGWLLLSLITCGIYHVFYQYKMGAAIVEIERNYDAIVFDKLPLVSLFATIFGLSIVVDCIHQDELNKVTRMIGKT